MKNKLKIDAERFKNVMKDNKGQKHDGLRLWVQKDVAAILGFSEVHFNNLVNGKKYCDEGTLRRLGELYGCGWKYLCGINDSQVYERVSAGLQRMQDRIAVLKALGYVVSIDENDDAFVITDPAGVDHKLTDERIKILFYTVYAVASAAATEIIGG